MLHNCILNFDAEPVYLKFQDTNVKNSKPETPNPEKNWFFENPKP